MIDDLGEHINACIVPVFELVDINGSQNLEYYVTEKDPGERIPVTWGVRLTGSASVDIELGATFHQSQIGLDYAWMYLIVPPNPFYNDNADYGKNAFLMDGPYGPVIMDWKVSGSNIRTFEVAHVRGDNKVETTEGFSIRLLVYDDGGTDAMINQHKQWWHIGILDDDVPISGIGGVKNKEVSIFPTIVNNFINIEIKDPSIIIQQVNLIDITGRRLDGHLDGDTYYLSETKSTGYAILYIYTNRGMVIKNLIIKN